ncbi:MAG TPA: hypothetical protein VGJ48_17675 [Pyrinomonadaceae bacterium]
MSKRSNFITRRSFIRTASTLPLLPAALTIVDASPGTMKTLAACSDKVGQTWANSSKALVLTDMTKCEPTSALSPIIKKGHWKVIPYELIAGPSGKMIWASPETEAPVMKLPLEVKGWHAILVGVFSGSEAPSKVHLKLEGDPASLMRANNSNECYGNVLEVFFKVANLQGESLEVGQQSSGFSSGCGVAYVKLVPLTPVEIEHFVKDRNDKSHRKMTATNDCFGMFFYPRPTTTEELLREVEIFRDTDFDTLILHALCGGDKVSYPSKYGHMPGQSMDDYLEPGHRYVAESIRELARKNINPIKVMIDGAHEIGMKVHVGMRPAGWTIFEPFPDFWETPFYRQHREWRCVDRDGTPVTRMSWAVPEVREHLINALCEAVGFGADGAHIVFNRGFPVVLYEPAFLQLFQKEYGEDPRKLDEEKDPRIRKAWSEVVTTFMRELRVRMDQEQVRRGDGKHLEISAMVLGTELNNYQYGVDIRRLVNESLLDEISIYPWDFGAKHVPKFGAYDLEFFNKVCKPKGIPFRPSIPTHWPELKDQVKEAISFYEAGAEGVCIWDAPTGDAATWNSIYSRLGHVDEMRLRLQNIQPLTPKPVYQCFHVLGEQVRDSRFPPWWGG